MQIDADAPGSGEWAGADAGVNGVGSPRPDPWKETNLLEGLEGGAAPVFVNEHVDVDRAASARIAVQPCREHGPFQDHEFDVHVSELPRNSQHIGRVAKCCQRMLVYEPPCFIANLVA